MVVSFGCGGEGAGGEGIIRYQGVVTREYPLWKLTLTGGDLPEAGHVMTSMSYDRLMGDMDDWLHWHQFGAMPTYDWPGESDLAVDAEQGFEGGYGEGYTVTFDCRWPEAVRRAEERFWAARKALEQARAALGEPIRAIADGLQAEDEDVAQIVHLPVKKVRRIMRRHREHELGIRQE